jgi:hypothetical protein
MTYHDCFECIGYMERRRTVLLPAMARRRSETGETAQQILDRYMSGVHRRHLSGLSLAATR